MARYTKTEVIHAEQWDGTEADAQNLIAELAHHGIEGRFVSGFFQELSSGPNSTKVWVTPFITFPGYHIRPTDFLVKEVLNNDSIVWSVKSEKQIASYEKG